MTQHAWDAGEYLAFADERGRPFDELVGRHVVTWDDDFPGYRRFYTADPSGNRVEILSPVGGASSGDDRLADAAAGSRADTASRPSTP